MADSPPNEQSIFLKAIEIASPEERTAFLNDVCGQDGQLRAEIEALLRAHDKPRRWLDVPDAANPTLDHPVSERPGTVIGPYKLMEQIGEGGFGLVFVADQSRPVRRKVALKIIKPGMDTREVLARFSAEQQALALMDHPNIARVFDAGTTETGRPYFVMELVKGVSIVEYFRQQRLTVQERLELFVTVCQAIQHAHTKGVIHRDLKPSNVMVAPHDGVPVIKVIDFGVAKAIGQQLTERTIYTSYAQMIGTPLYMSPEQAEINALDVDIRSDVYSLGVLLYELLTGTTPLDRGRISSATYDEIRRIIKEEDPPKPSTRLSTLGKLLTTVSIERKIESSKLSKLIRDDLDWIVMKSLEKERKRRYQTAAALAEDVRRFLDHELIEARPPSLAYRARKFLRRNRAAVLVAATIFLAMTLTILGTSVGMVKARDAAERATQLTREKDDALSALAEIHGVTEEKNQALDEANRSLEEQQSELLFSQAKLLTERRATGYKAEVFSIIRELLTRPLAEDDRARLRRLALGCLGDPVALEPIDVLDSFGSEVARIDMNPSGTWLSVCLSNGEAFLYDLVARKRTVVNPPGKSHDNFFPPMNPLFVNDRLLVVTQRRPGVQFWEQAPDLTWSQGTRFKKYPLIDSAVTPDGPWMALSRITNAKYLPPDRVGGDKVSLWDISNPASPDFDTSFQVPEEVSPDPSEGSLIVDVDPAGRFLAGVYWESGVSSHTVIWDIASGTARVGAGGTRVKFSPTGRWLAVTSTSGVELFDTDYLDEFPNRPPDFYQRSDVVRTVCFADGGRTLVIPGRQTSLVRIWDVSGNRELGTLRHPDKPLDAVVSANGSLLATASRTSVRIWQLNRLPERTQLAGHEGGTRGLAYSPDGALLATTGGNPGVDREVDSGEDASVKLWDPITGERIPDLKGGGQHVAFSSDGRWLAAGSAMSSRVWVWDTQTWDLLAEFDAKVGQKTWCVRFCHSDSRLAVSGMDGLRLLSITKEPDFLLQDFEEDGATLLTTEQVTHVVANESMLLWLQHDAPSSEIRKTSVRGIRFALPDQPVDYEFQSYHGTLFGLAILPEGGFLHTNRARGAIEHRGFDGRLLGKSFSEATSELFAHPSRPWVTTNNRSRNGADIYDWRTGESILRLGGRGTTLWYVAWHPAGNQVALAYSGGFVELWNIDAIQKELSDLGLLNEPEASSSE